MRCTTLPNRLLLLRQKFVDSNHFLVMQIQAGLDYNPKTMGDRSGKVGGTDDDDDDDEEEEAKEDEEKKNLADVVGTGGEGGRRGGKVVKTGTKRREKFIVTRELFPVVFRWDFDQAGNYMSTVIVVRKAVVIAGHPDTYQGGAAVGVEL